MLNLWRLLIRAAVKRLEILHIRITRLCLSDDKFIFTTLYDAMYLYMTNRTECREACLNNVGFLRTYLRIWRGLTLPLSRHLIALFDDDLVSLIGFLCLYSPVEQLGFFQVTSLPMFVYMFAQCELDPTSPSSRSRSSLRTVLRYI